MAYDAIITQMARLFTLSGANMQSTSDQAFSKAGTFNNYVITNIIARQASGGTSIACLGGIYTGASKTGNVLVAAAQSWVLLTATGKIVLPVLGAPLAADQQSATPILSLSTGSTAPATADFFIFGFPLD